MNISIIGNPNRERKSQIDFDLARRLNEYYSKPENIKKENQADKPPVIEPVIINPNIVKSDYIQIPGQDFITAIAETDFGLNYEDAHKTILKRGLNSHTPREFMSFHNYIIDCYDNKKPIYNAEGNPIPNETLEDLYNQLTSNCGTWLNGKFHIQDNEKAIEYIAGLDSRERLLTKREDLEPYLEEDCYIDFTKLNKNGLPNISSRYPNQELVKGKNIYFYIPVDGGTARFYADSGIAKLRCSWNPHHWDPIIGVRTKALLIIQPPKITQPVKNIDLSKKHKTLEEVVSQIYGSVEWNEFRNRAKTNKK